MVIGWKDLTWTSWTNIKGEALLSEQSLYLVSDAIICVKTLVLLAIRLT